MTSAPNIAALYEAWHDAQQRWFALPSDGTAGPDACERIGAALMAAEDAIDASPAVSAGDVLLKLAATAPRSKDHDTPEFVSAVIGEAVGIVERQRAAHASVAGKGVGLPAASLFPEAEREHWRLETALRVVEQRPLFSDADRATADADARTIVDRQLAIETAVYAVPAESLHEMVIKARFLRRNADADLPPDLTIAGAYVYRPQFGRRLPCGVASLWADLERLALPAPRPLGTRDRRLLAIRPEWEAATAAVNERDISDAETDARSERQVALEREAFSLPADTVAGLAVKAHIAMHNETGGTRDVTPAGAYAGQGATLDQHAILSLWADIQRLAAWKGGP